MPLISALYKKCTISKKCTKLVHFFSLFSNLPFSYNERVRIQTSYSERVATYNEWVTLKKYILNEQIKDNN